jgi:hypothetical protein
MKILALEEALPGAADSSATSALLAEEARRVWELVRSGVIRQIHFRKDRNSAVLELECGDGEEAAAVLASLPLVREKRIRFEVIPLVPYDGWARLFGGG